MRYFLYLDHDLVDSIIAQENKGLVTGLSENQEKQHEENNSESIKADVNPELNASLASILSGKISANIEGTKKEENGIVTSNSKVITKILHDAAFDIAFSAVSPKTVNISETVDSHGEYVLLKRTYTIVDFDELETLFGKDGLLDFKKSLEESELEEAVNKKINELSANLSRDKLKSESSKLRHKMDQVLKVNHKQYDDMAQSVRLLRNIVPYDRMLVSVDGYIIPMDDVYFRTNAKNMAFKYGGEITCVGLITNIIENDSESNTDDVFTSLQNSINTALINLLPTNGTKIYIVQPIAIYYE